MALNVEDVFKKLNFMEKNAIHKYLEGEKMKGLKIIEEEVIKQEQYLANKNLETWEIFGKIVEMAMRDLNISRDRINKINTRIDELAKDNEDKLLMNLDRNVTGFETLTKDEYEDLIEELIQGRCKGCTTLAKDCSLHVKLLKHKIPGPGHRGQCKYRF